MSVKNYDDDAALRPYIANQCRHLMTPLERRVTEYNEPIVSNCTNPSQAARAQIKWLYHVLERRDGHVDDAEVLAAFQQPIEVREATAVERVLSEHRQQLNVKRCPRCSGVLRSPLAEQCFWCGHDWHGLGDGS